MIAALYVQNGGAYYGIDDVDPWDEARDARLYDGPWPVVAHPPCARWLRFAGFTEARFGLKRGDDGGCFAAALAAVRRFGGVIEHPAYSDAWAAFDLPRPTTWRGWTGSLFDPGWSCYVEQGRYGMPVKKATWLYVCGIDDLPELRWGYTPDSDGPNPRGEHGGMDNWRDSIAAGVSTFDYFKGHRHDGARSATPPEFRDALLAIARAAASCAAASPELAKV